MNRPSVRTVDTESNADRGIQIVTGYLLEGGLLPGQVLASLPIQGGGMTAP